MTQTPPPDIVALAGPNGAGKSTIGPVLLRETLGITTFVNADVIAQGLSAFDPGAAAFEAGRILLERLYRPLATSWRLYDNSAGPPPRLIATGRESGRLEVLDEATWSRIEKGKEHEG